MRAGAYRAYAALRARPLLRELADLERTQWLPPRDLEALQIRRLRSMLAHAGATVPYYRRLFESVGFEPARLDSLAGLEALPVLDRATLAARFDDLRSEAAGPSPSARSTGGSTGRPLRFLVDRHEMTRRSAHIYRNLRWLGWRLGDRTAYVWGSDIDSRDHRGWRGTLRDRVAGVLWLDAFAMEAGLLDQYLDQIESFGPKAIIGYPSSLHLLAKRALATGRRIRAGGVQTSAETLAEEVRRDLGAAFGCRVLDRYGCREAGVIAHECPEGGLHVNAESVVTEAREGELLVTTLANRSMPLIRYRNEDLVGAPPGACPCGRGLPLLGRVRGRVSDVVRTPGGRLLHGEFFTHLFYDTRGVTRFQVRQTALDRLEILLVATDEFGEEGRRRIESAILAHADAAFRIDWLPVSEIPPGPSGKFHFTISNIHKSA